MKIISKFLLITTLLISNSAYSAITTEDITIERLVAFTGGGVAVFGDKILESAGVCSNTVFFLQYPTDTVYSLLLDAYNEGTTVDISVDDNPGANRICYINWVSVGE